MEARGGSELDRGEIEIAGVRRSYWLARAPRQGGQVAPPLLIALHGSGMDGQGMAWFTGLAKRGPAAGITTVFPDGWKGAWHPVRPPAGEPDLNDAQFLAELATHLEGLGAARSWPVFLTGISQGARYAEHIARNGLLPVTGLFLVAGTALEASRRMAPVPQLRASMILVMGTSDPTSPYTGGRLTRRGLSGRILKRRAVKHGEQPGEDLVAGAEELVADWAAGNGITVTGITATGSIARPRIEELAGAPGDLPVTKKTWARPGCHPATLYRIDGGGHGWPGGPQFLPSRVIGPIAKHLDATGLLLDMAERETALALGHPALTRGENSAEAELVGFRDESAAPQPGSPPWPPAPRPAEDGPVSFRAEPLIPQPAPPPRPPAERPGAAGQTAQWRRTRG
jgi:polyhydroxybutyrate depolymerase